MATALYMGFLPLFPGTWGSLGGLAAFLLLRRLPWAFHLLVLAGLFLAGVYVAGRAEVILGERDARPIVIDELFGMWASVSLLPSGPFFWASAFLLFRLFDVVKPYPARRAQALPSGWGVMADDLVASLYTNLSVRLLDLLLHGS